jgi:hypothetical protein
MSDHDIEELLRDGMSAEAAEVRLPHHVFGRATRRYGRRRAATRVAGVAAGTALVVAAGALVATNPLAHHGGTGTVGAAGSAPRLEDVADIRPKLVQALDASHAIIRTAVTNTDPDPSATPLHQPPKADGGQSSDTSTKPSDQSIDNWFDPDTGYLTAYTYENGALWWVDRYPVPVDGTLTSVDYRQHTWYSEPAQAFPPNTATSGKAGEPLLDTVAGVKAAVNRKDIQVVGHQRIDGRDATHLRFTVKRDDETITGDAWFDSETYVPLRSATTYGTPATGTVTETTTFLPRTAANVAKTTPTPPAGFRRVAAPSK